MLSRNDLIDKMNKLAALRQSFVFIIDFKGENGYIFQNYNTIDSPLKFELQQTETLALPTFEWHIDPVSYDIYKQKFDYVQDQIKLGNSFLVNLTQPSTVYTNLTVNEIYKHARARYKVWLKNEFIALSPETFVRIKDGRISSFPMKGTIDASIPNADSIIINDLKEKAEHATIVDLIRNDLSIVANKVEVKRYRYIEQLQTNRGSLLQISSEITGILPPDYRKRLGNIIFSMLPAGSISGAPKPKTIEIIEQTEGYTRGFYTGIFGVFDGTNLDSAVLIRYLDLNGDLMIFKSGGGITAKSICSDEYNELLHKVYLPIY